MKKNDSKNEFISLLGRFFTEYLPVSVNASPNTIASYKCAFRLLFQYLNEETDIKIGHRVRGSPLGVRGNALYRTARPAPAPGLRSSRCLSRPVGQS